MKGLQDLSQEQAPEREIYEAEGHGEIEHREIGACESMTSPNQNDKRDRPGA